ncbi:MAG: FAD-dependent monooxygenase [Rhodopirellula sp.]|nr:FAD-dependent monooxygenase [Rhodopirellula sp.]
MTNIAHSPLDRTINPDAAATKEWDVIVIGAGPAGALAATLLARHGVRTLLIERKKFPRYKVCGACLNPVSLAILRSVQLEHTFTSGVALNGFHLQSRGRALKLDLPGSLSISRERFDAELVRAAINAGVQFLSECIAKVLPARTADELNLSHPPFRDVDVKPDGAASRVLRASIVIAADGLTHSCLAGLDEFSSSVKETSRIGAGVVIPDAPSFYQAGRIYMAVGRGGYAGLVRLEDQRLNIAAALDSGYVRDCGSLVEAARRIVAAAGFPVLDALSAESTCEWHGTPALTRSTMPLAAHRLFVVGDAAGYVEPFTGEGIAWALASAKSVVPLVQCASLQWDDLLKRTWQSDWMQAVGHHQVWCRRLATLLRYPAAVSTITSIVSTCPWLAGPVVRSLNRVPEPAALALRSSTTARKAG